jgi:hypothetical protein
MVLTIGNIMIPVSLMAVLLPLAVYFLILGLLNSRSRPQVLTGAEDGLILIGAMSALFWPTIVVNFGIPLLAAVLAGSIVIAGVIMRWLCPRTWVIYNLPENQVERLWDSLMDAVGASPTQCDGEWELPDGAIVTLDRFPLFRNVSIHLRGGDETVRRQLGRTILDRMAATTTDTAPAAMMLLLLAVIMLAWPLMAMAPQADEIARRLAEFFQ